MLGAPVGAEAHHGQPRASVRAAAQACRRLRLRTNHPSQVWSGHCASVQLPTMSDRNPSVTNLDRYGNPALPWSRALDQLAGTPSQAITFFLGTCSGDGDPHAAGVGAAFVDGEMYFTSSPAARKARDLVGRPRCTLSARMPGIDLVLEGATERVIDPGTLDLVAARYREGGWPAQVEGDAFTAPFNAPSAGPPPWHLYRLTLRAATGVATAEPFGATRWRFAR